MFSELIQSEHWSARGVLEIRRHATTSSVAAPWIRSEAKLALRNLGSPFVASSLSGDHFVALPVDFAGTIVGPPRRVKDGLG